MSKYNRKMSIEYILQNKEYDNLKILFGNNLDKSIIQIIKKIQNDEKQLDEILSNRIPLNYNINKENLEKFINASDNSVKNILRKLINVTNHVSFETFIFKINKGINNLLKYSINNRPIFVYINTNETNYTSKSNYWLYLYLKKYLKKNNPNINLLFCNTLDDDNIKDNDLIVFIDDCLYSGEQTSNAISGMKNANDKKLKIFMLVAYSSENALTKIKKSFINNKNLDKCKQIINDNVEIIKSLNQIFSSEEIKQFEKIFNFYYNKPSYKEGTKIPIYFDHKLADNVSTWPLIYSGIVPNEKNKKALNILENMEHITDIKSAPNVIKERIINYIDIYPLINHCQHIRNIDEMSPKCPYPLYKKSYSEYLKNIRKNVNKFNSFNIGGIGNFNQSYNINNNIDDLLKISDDDIKLEEIIQIEKILNELLENIEIALIKLSHNIDAKTIRYYNLIVAKYNNKYDTLIRIKKNINFIKFPLIDINKIYNIPLRNNVSNIPVNISLYNYINITPFKKTEKDDIDIIIKEIDKLIENLMKLNKNKESLKLSYINFHKATFGITPQYKLLQSNIEINILLISDILKQWHNIQNLLKENIYEHLGGSEKYNELRENYSKVINDIINNLSFLKYDLKSEKIKYSLSIININNKFNKLFKNFIDMLDKYISSKNTKLFSEKIKNI